MNEQSHSVELFCAFRPSQTEESAKNEMRKCISYFWTNPESLKITSQ